MLNEEAFEKALRHYDGGGCCGLTDREERECVQAIIEEYLDALPKEKPKPIKPTLHDMVATAAITGLCMRAPDPLFPERIANDAHEIASAYCAAREKEMK